MRRRRGKDGSIGGNISAEIDDKNFRVSYFNIWDEREENYYYYFCLKLKLFLEKF